MMNTAAALYGFYSGFGLPAYAVGSVPEDAVLPYITYSLVETESFEAGTHYAQVWYRSTSNAEVLAKVDAIKRAIGQGVRLPCDGGYVVIRPQTPFAQILTELDRPENRSAYINLQINCYHM